MKLKCTDGTEKHKNKQTKPNSCLKAQELKEEKGA
jgi:hypothetical protein